jgi:Ni,Fe-hydrogenase III large subunit
MSQQQWQGISGQRASQHRGAPRLDVDRGGWLEASSALASGRFSLLGLWGDDGIVHMAVQVQEEPGEMAVLSLACAEGTFPSVGRLHPPAIRLERTIRDLFGLVPEDAPDLRPWLDHGRWGVRHPLGNALPAPAEGDDYEFLPAEGEGLHKIPVGPVHAGVIEPGHFRFTVNGETVVRLEARLGYTHKGIEGLMRGAGLGHGAQLASHVSGDSAVAYALAFARAAETALEIEVPARAHHLRALMAEIERLANHLGDIGAICNDAAFSLMLAHCGVLRERTLRAAEAAFGHRLMRGVIVPGGVGDDLTGEDIAAIEALVAEIRAKFPELVALYDNTTSLQDRTVATGILRPELARRFAAGGYVGRASGRAFDGRKAFAYAPYDRLSFEVPVFEEGDVNARVWVRIREVEESLSLIEQLLGSLPEGAIVSEILPAHEVRESIAIVEGFRGDILVWLRLGANGTIERCHLRDPSWFQWPLLEAAIEGNIVADFPLCNKSFNCSYSGHDL